METAIVPRNWIVAEFPTPAGLLEAAQTLREGGLTDIDTHTPYPLHGAEKFLGLKRSRVPLIALIGGIVGGVSGLVMQWWMNGYDWPLNIGNRPPFSAPAAIPITFECTVLFAALSIFFGTLALSGFPRPYHPAFDAEEFRSHSTHGFWLSIALPEGSDAQNASGKVSELGASLVKVVQEQVE
jgi:hypothetical protein